MSDVAVLESLHHGHSLATTIPSSRVGWRAWLGVYSLDRNRSGTRTVLRRLGVPVPSTDEPFYRIRAFEVEERLIADAVCISEEELHSLFDVIAFGDEELRFKLAERGVSLDQLDVPLRSDYPI